MTQIIGVVHQGLNFHLSDRLLTREGNAAPVDRRSNKSVVVISTDAFVTLGYSGNASIRREWTDEWIAHVIESTSQTHGWRLERIIGALHHAVIAHVGWLAPMQRSRFVLLVQIVGHLRTGPQRADAVGYELVCRRGSVTARENFRADTHDGLPRWLATPSLPSDGARRLSTALTGLAGAGSPVDVAQAMLDAQRTVTVERPSVVGRDFLLVTTSPQGQPLKGPEEDGRPSDAREPVLRPVTISYLPTDSRDVVNLGPLGRHPVAYSPWIVSPWRTISPTVVTPGVEFGIPGTPVSYRMTGMNRPGLPASIVVQAQDRSATTATGVVDIESEMADRLRNHFESG